MKKVEISKAAVMARAWEIRKNSTAETTMSEALRKAWKEAKENMTAEENKKVVFVNGMDIEACGYVRTLNRWTKGGHDRIYINGGSRKGDGWVDIKTGFVHLNNNLTYTKRMAEMILDMEYEAV